LLGAKRQDAELVDMMRPTDVQELVDAVEEAEERLTAQEPATQESAQEAAPVAASEVNTSKRAGRGEERG
jgi:hypothetical protein